MRHGRIWLALPLLVVVGWLIGTGQEPRSKSKAPAAKVTAEDASEELSPEELKDKQVAERFQQVLENNPRRGTALDRLYGYHVERGTLDKLINVYRDRTKKKETDGIAWMIVGLLESQRGKDALAVTAFREAEKQLTDNAMAPYYLGQSLVLVGQPDAAAEAFERAISRKPNRNDLLDIFQALGRVYQRAQRTEKALDVWNRLEKLFPDDPRVQDQIATTLVEESQFAQALPRFEKLIKQTQDPYRKSTLQMEAAELKVRLKRTPEALKDFEKLLSELNPESWLYREVRRKIEDVFLRNDDLTGLVKYYEGWVEKNPNDIESIARLSKALANQGRLPDARKWLEKGLDVAPTNKQLRHALIDQLVYEQKYADAAAQYELLDKNEPNNPDTLREWGKVLLRDHSKSEADRKAAAVAAWKKLLDKKPNDPVAHAQVADLLRSAQLVDEAIALYKKAIELAPNDPQYREYLGEYYHTLKRTDDAMATWRPIAEGPNRNAKNLTRLAEVLSGFGYKKEAAPLLADAVQLDKDDINLRLAYSDLLFTLEQFDDSLAQLDVAAKLISNGEEAESVLQAQIKVYQATDSLDARTAELQKELNAGTNATADRWHRLARYYEASRQSEQATVAIDKASTLDPKSVPILTAAARIHESGGSLSAAADIYRKLARLDRRYITEHLTAVAKLESRLGRRDQALQAGRDLLAAAPGNPDHYKFFADLCFQLGDPEEGLESLRRSVRANPSEPGGLLTLATALTDRQRAGEAIELLWRAFEKTNELEGKLSIIGSLTDLYLQQNQFDKLLERLERERNEAEKSREMTLCISQAYQSAGDFGTARQQLERLLTENTRDTALLAQLSQLAEAENDLQSSVKYQRQLEKNAPNNKDAQLRLAQLLMRSGEVQEAAEMWVKLVTADPDEARNITAIDTLFTAEKYDTVLAITTRLLAQKPGNWELIYREAACLAELGKQAEAISRFKAILTMRMPDDELGAVLKEKRKDKKKPTATAVAVRTSRSTARMDQVTVPLIERIERVHELRSVTGIEPRYYYGGGRSPSWTPTDFGAARMGALGWLLGMGMKDNNADSFLKPYKEAKDRANADARARWDWYYLQLVRQDYKAIFEVARDLAKSNDPAGQFAYLTSLGNRTIGSGPRYARGGDPERDNTPPLPPEQLDLALSAYQSLKKQKPDWLAMGVAQNLVRELKRAKRAQDEQAIYREGIANANTPTGVLEAMAFAGDRGDVDTVVALFQKLEKLQGPAKGTAYLPTRQAPHYLTMTMQKRATAKAFDDVIKLADLYLAHQRRLSQQAAQGPAGTRPRTRSSVSGGASYVTIAGPGGSLRSINIDFPSPNDYFDEGAIQMLRSAFEIYRKADLVSDLFAHYRKLAETGPAEDKVYHLLAIGYMHWWNGEKEESLNQLTLASKQVPGDLGLLMDVAELRERQNEPSEALAMLDSITPLDHNTMQRRERAALRLAERTGNVARAREAADRLFGLRLDAETQVELAGKMHKLGMHEMAETVLSRAQRQAGNRTNALVSLMNQYQSNNQQELAVQIARQLLRKAPTMNFDPYRGYREEDGARTQAVQVLSRSGKLGELIERAEAQLKSSPNAVQIHQGLLDLYKASGDKEKFKATVKRIAELKPDDGKLHFYLAQQLQQMGENAAACEHYLTGIKKEPRLFAYRYWEIFQIFQQANKMEDLQKLFDEIDFRVMGGYWVAMEVIQPLLADEKTRPHGMKLFKKLWEAFPGERRNVMSYLGQGNVSELPEIYDYSRQAVIPRDDSPLEPWAGAEDIMSYSGDGRVSGVVTQLIAIAQRQNRTEELQAEVAQKVAKFPDWSTGQAMLAIFDLQAGNVEAARKRWQGLLDDKKNPMPFMARYVLGQELAYFGSMQDLYLKTLEGAVDETLDSGNDWEFSYSPIRQLVTLYEKLGRKDDARALVQKTLRNTSFDYDPGYSAYRRINNAQGVAGYFLQIGEPVEAVRIFNELLADRDTLQAASRYYDEGMEMMVEQQMRSAVKALKPEHLPAAIHTLLTPREGTGTSRNVLDLVLLVEPRNLTKATLSSMMANALRGSIKKPELRAEVLDKLQKLAGGFPKDISVQVAVALGAAAEEKPEALAASADRLTKLMEGMPLEPLPAGTRPNSRQRAEALAQVPLWLVARECLTKKELCPLGNKLAERALQAARRQQDTLYATAILREWGQIELDRGDRKSAEARWAQLLELVLPAPAAKKAGGSPAAGKSGGNAPATPAAPAVTPAPGTNQKSMLTPSRFLESAAALIIIAQAAAPAPPLATPLTAPAQPPIIPIVNGTQFSQAMQIAKLAAEKEMTALSLRALRDAVRGGPPVSSPDMDRMRGRIRSVYTSSGQIMTIGGDDGSFASVESSVPEMVRIWRKAKVPPADVYEVLAEAVLPAARPAEVFLYSSGVNYGDLTQQSIGNLLIEVAVEAKKTDDLRKRIQARASQPLGELPAQVLLAQLSLQGNDPAEALAALKRFGERLQKDTLQNTADAVVPIGGAALERPDLAPAALALLERAAKNLAANNVYQNAQNLMFRIARYHLDAKNVDVAKRTFKDIEELGKKAAMRNADNFRVQQAQRLAEEYLRAGWLNDALEQFARYADGQTPGPPTRPRDIVWTNSMGSLCQHLLDLPVDKRYEMLKGWTLPATSKTVRIIGGPLPQHIPVAAFGKFTVPGTDDYATTLSMLLDAASATNKLPDLAADVEKRVAGKVEHADTVKLIVALSLGKGGELAKELDVVAKDMNDRATRVTPRPPGPRYYPGGRGDEGPAQVRALDYFLARACLNDPKSLAVGERMMKTLLDQAKRTHNAQFGYLARRDLANVLATRFKVKGPLEKIGLDRWYNASARSIWTAIDGHLMLVNSNQPSYLLFDAPLTGTFEFSVDGYQGGWSEGHAGYGGYVFEPNRGNVGSSVWSVGNRDRINLPGPPIRDESFNRLTIKVDNGKVSAYMNGTLYYEDTEPGGTSPWVMIAAGSQRSPVWRNFVMSGKPEVLSEVKLTGGKSLDGWMTHLYGASMPSRMLQKQQDAQRQAVEGLVMGNFYGYADTEANRQALRPQVFDWDAKDGEIVGRKLDSPGRDPVPSKLAYFRPLRAGEKLRYEFFYEPGKSHVHPSLGRLAFLLEPTGVRLHWLTDLPQGDWTGLKGDNAVDEPSCRRGPKELPFKAGDWNKVLLSVTNDTMTLELNGTVIYERKLEPTTERLFGFFHYRDKTAVRVRNVVLTGNWPKELKSLDEASFVAKEDSRQAARVRRELITEQKFSLSANLILEKARKLSPAEQYKLYADWVFPRPGRTFLELAGDWTPLDVAPPEFVGPLPEGSRVLLGSRFDAPALELVRLAKELNRLEVLAATVEMFTVPKGDRYTERSKIAMLAALYAAQGQTDKATTALQQLTELVKTPPTNAPVWRRWPEYFAARSTMSVPALIPKATALLNEMVLQIQHSHEQQKPFPARDNWEHEVRRLRGEALALALPELQRRPYGSDPGLAYWARMEQVQAWTRGQGFPPAHWALQNGEMKHFAGHQEDYFVLRTPLRGNFTVECELTSFGWREAHLAYGGLRFDFLYDRKSYFLHRLDRGGPKKPIDPPIEKVGDWYPFKMEVKDGKVTYYVAGQKISTEGLGINPDPWLMMHSMHNCMAGVRKLKITGDPTVPEVVDLTTGPDLKGWRGYYGGTFEKRGEEVYLNGQNILKQQVEGQPPVKRQWGEQAMHYHRPMVEDGTINYEFYFEPDKTMAHPATDRLVFLLEPDGVRIHWLTDNNNERSALKKENIFDEPANRRGPAKLPLKEKAWNALKLTLKGDTVSLNLNGQDVYERKLESTNLRTFGVFHWTDLTELRVRNVTWRGDWPKQVPAAGEMFKVK